MTRTNTQPTSVIIDVAREIEREAATTPKRTRNTRSLGAGEAADRILTLRKAQQAEIESAYAELIAKHKTRQAEREQQILARCADPDRARAILAMGTEE